MNQLRRPAPAARAFAATLLAFALGSIPARARAQIGFEDLLGSITDISVSGTCWSTRSEAIRSSECPGGRNGYGLEVLWALAKVPLRGETKTETTWVPSQKRVIHREGRVDTVTVLTPKEKEDTTGYRVLIELGLGYSQFSGFTSTDDRFELRGTVREVPSVAVYASLEGPPHSVVEHINPYVGIRSGLIMLSDVQLFTPVTGDSTTAYRGSAEVFQVGGAVGISAGNDVASVFLEAQLNLRRFTSVDWTGGAGGTIPGFLPRGLDFTGASLSVGVQVHVRNSEDAKD
jgi:hypothetical protein